MPHTPQMITDPSTAAADAPSLPSPIAPKEGLGLLDRLSLVEWAVQSAIIGDNGPLTSSPNQRRNMALVFFDVAGQLLALAQRIDPLAQPVAPDKIAPFTPAAQDPVGV